MASPLPTKVVAQRVADEGLSLAEVRRALPADCLVPVPWRSWLALVRVYALAGACLVVLVHLPVEAGWSLAWQLPALVVMWFLYGAALDGIFLVGHDAEHGAFSTSPRVNRLVGYLCLAPLFNGTHTWKLTHDHHHVYTQLRGQDVDWAANLVTAEEMAALSWRDDFAIKLGYAIPFGVFFWIGRNTVRRGVSVRAMLGEAIYEREKAELRRSNALMWACTVAIYAAFWHGFGVWGMVKLHAVPLLFAGLIGGVLVAIGHASGESLLYAEAGDDGTGWSPVRGQLASTYNYRLPRWFEWLILNINVHVPHHVSVAIPWYKLGQANAALREAFPEYVQELPLTWAEVAWIEKAPFLRYDAGLGAYEMDLGHVGDSCPRLVQPGQVHDLVVRPVQRRADE